MTLQNDLDTMYNWAEEVGMEFNSSKFELLRFWVNKEEAPDFQYEAPDGNFIEEKSDLRDLGVRISSDLSFSLQIELAVQSGNQMAGWALRTFRGRGKWLMLTVLRSLMQPRLDYCSQLWSPRDQKSINMLETVQRNFLNKIRSSDLTGKTYWEKLKILRVYSQERRRERYMICLLWKASQGLTEGISVTWQSEGPLCYPCENTKKCTS